MSGSDHSYLDAITELSSEQIEVGTNTVITVSRQIQIVSPADTIWELLINFERWPDWNSKVTKIKTYGDCGPGTVIKWKVDHVKIKSVLQSVVPCQELSWSGTAIGIKAIHTYELQEANHTTLVKSTVRWSGILPKLLKKQMEKRLEESVSSGLEFLGKAAGGIRD